MTTLLDSLFLSIVAVGVVFVIFRAGRAYFRFRGTRLVTCPETKQAAAVTLDAGKAARESIVGAPHFRLDECSRWPERQDCGQECLRQIEMAPQDCLVRNIVAQWYVGKKCVYCGKPIETVDDFGHHRPALLDARRETTEWNEIRPEKLPEVFAAYLPVCWSCHIAETFRREHADLVVDRPRR
jgi:hypothetical protein